MLILVSAMLVGVLSAARLGDVAALVSGNVAGSDGARQAAEVGINAGFAAVKTLASEETNSGSWYYATRQAADAAGVPKVDWGTAPSVDVGRYAVQWVVDRQCTVAPVTDTLRQCLVRQVPQLGSAREGADTLDPPNARQFRVTVRVSGPRGTLVYTQALLSRG